MVNNDHVEVCDLCTDPVQVLLLKKTFCIPDNSLTVSFPGFPLSW